MVTCPSAISTALLSLRTHKTVVPCICALPWLVRIQSLYSGVAGPSHAKHDEPPKTMAPCFFRLLLLNCQAGAVVALPAEPLLEAFPETSEDVPAGPSNLSVMPREVDSRGQFLPVSAPAARSEHPAGPYAICRAHPFLPEYTAASLLASSRSLPQWPEV